MHENTHLSKLRGKVFWVGCGWGDRKDPVENQAASVSLTLNDEVNYAKNFMKAQKISWLFNSLAFLIMRKYFNCCHSTPNHRRVSSNWTRGQAGAGIAIIPLSDFLILFQQKCLGPELLKSLACTACCFMQENPAANEVLNKYWTHVGPTAAAAGYC